jgi:hypothetical protein
VGSNKGKTLKNKKNKKKERIKMRKYTLRELQAMETISQGHTDNLKIKTEDTKVWLSRMTVEDGMPYNNMVTIEKLTNDGRWETVEEYPAR